MGEFRLEANMHQMKHWSDYLESDSDSKSEEEDTKENEKLTPKPAKKEKVKANPYSFKHWRYLLETDSDEKMMNRPAMTVRKTMMMMVRREMHCSAYLIMET